MIPDGGGRALIRVRKEGSEEFENHCHIGLHAMQTPELYYDQEQADNSRQARIQKIL